MNFLAKELAKLGLSILEAEVYLGLLQRRLTTAGALSKHIGMKRSTVYTVLDTLVQKGLVSTTQINAVKNYQAESPDRIGDFLRKQKEDLALKEGIFYSLSEELDSLHKSNTIAPKITIYEGQRGVNTLLMKNLDDEPKEVLVIGEFMKDGDHLHKYTTRRIEMGIPTRVITAEGDTIKKMMKGDTSSFRKTHLLDGKYKFPASIHIYDQSIAVFTYTGEDPVGVYIENADISKTLRMVFKLLEEGISTDQ